MFLKQLLLPALLVASTIAHPGAHPRAGIQFCGTPDPTEEQIKTSKALLEYERSHLRPRAERKLIVDTHFHVVAASGREEDGNVTQKQLDDQLATLNEAYAPHGISFNLVNVSRTISAEWADEFLSDYGIAVKKSLRQGDYSTLNVYFVKTVRLPSLGTVSGYCFIPDRMPAPMGPDNVHLDGCVISVSSMPGGSKAGRNLGLTAVHEVGHWFNLFHPFEGGCDDEDLVDDTPAHIMGPKDIGTCNVGKDSCPDLNGTDPVHNYMTWSDDSCLTEFTPGQEDRIYSSWDLYRQNSTRSMSIRRIQESLLLPVG